MQGNAFELQATAYDIARGAGYWRNDGQLIAGQAVQQARLANVGLPGENDM